MPRKRQKPLSFCVFPEYRWCGPGCSGPGAPINDVDACCYRHDRCYSSGRQHCQCDHELINCLQSKMNPHTVKGRQAALMYRVMKFKTTFCY
ncbi:phospholipase [Lederbergia citrea]|uniref:phospholipase n=1 Tax=Lederbergia citrea TaxID=2833581 RepID=UPI002016716B|nr:phospholipase [Lederbergia citrea]